jgi:hypothetical protein
MTDEISVFLDARDWQDLLTYEPFRAGASLGDDVRARLRTAALVSQEHPTPRELRLVGLSMFQALRLQTWLFDVMRRPDAPRGVRGAVLAVSDAMRVAE